MFISKYIFKEFYKQEFKDFKTLVKLYFFYLKILKL
jgi:hypothetical protein